jgi:hypothetical protein
MEAMKNRSNRKGTEHLEGKEQINLTSLETREGHGTGMSEDGYVSERKNDKKKLMPESPQAVDESTSFGSRAPSSERNHSRSGNQPNNVVRLCISEGRG